MAPMDIRIVKILVQLVRLAVTRLPKSNTLNSNPPLLRSYTIATTSFLESGQFYVRLQARAFHGPQNTSEPHCYSPFIDGGECPTRTPNFDSRWSWAQEAVDSRLQEQFSGAPVWAQSQKQAWSGHPLRPHQLLNGS